MIEKIIQISNVGHFVNFKLRPNSRWNGSFKQVNVIYAPNGSGKTTLSTIFKSLAQNDLKLIAAKKTFGSSETPQIKIKQFNRPEPVTLQADSWSLNDLSIEVFDINYVEEYLFAGSFHRKQNKVSLFKLLLGQHGIDLKKNIKPIIKDNNALIELIAQSDEDSLKNSLAENELRLTAAVEEFDRYAAGVFAAHVAMINKYLKKFTRYIRLIGFSCDRDKGLYELFRIFPVFEVYGQHVTFSADDPAGQIGNARYSMSEGDKSTIALCFFLGRLELNGVVGKVIVFDDPLSSFDYSRRQSTITQLVRIAEQASQFILLTHDLGFANEFSLRCGLLDPINLQINRTGGTSVIDSHDINAEFLTPTQKDLNVIKDFLSNPNKTEQERREVVRCIRPAIEGIVKTKYFDSIPNNKWLGDMLDMIRNASSASRLHRLQPLLNDLSELNDYSKPFHHASGSPQNSPIDPEELHRYINLLMDTINEI